MSRAVRPSPATLGAWRAFLEAHAALTRRLDQELRQAHDLALTSYDVLLQLSEAGGRLRMSDLADAVLLSRPNCTRLVDRLVHEGLVDREADPSDARVRWARLTPEGRRRFRRAAATHLAGIEQHFGRHLGDTTATTLASAFTALSSAGR